MSSFFDSVNDCYNIGYEKLNDFQKDVHQECINLNKGGLSLTMGSGKTFLSIVVALDQLLSEMENPTDVTMNKILVVCSKSLLNSWVSEIKKFFGNKLPFEIYHKDYIKNILTHKFNDNTIVILTTNESMKPFYKNNNIERKFVDKRRVGNGHGRLENDIVYYNTIDSPFAENKGAVMIVDEAQDYTTITTDKSRCICSICAKHKWALSGTLFNEPKSEKFLGYFIMIDFLDVPRNIPDIQKYLNDEFEGLDKTMVKRENNEAFLNPPKMNAEIITHEMFEHEKIIYRMCNKLFIEIDTRLKNLLNQDRHGRDTEAIQILLGHRTGLFNFLRQAVVFPFVPLAVLSIDVIDMSKRNELTNVVKEKLNELNIDLNDVSKVKSSRCIEILKLVDKHQEKIVIFNCWLTSISLLSHYIENREIFFYDSSLNCAKRDKVLEDFKNSEKGILFLTYQIGSQGLNLQFCRVAILTDFFWNDGTTRQSIARIFRYGQKAKEVFVYYLTSNTGIENAIFSKHEQKKIILEELQTGSSKNTVSKMSMEDVVKILRKEEILEKIEKIKI